MRTVRLADIEGQPWKNGGGTTRPLADGRGWRISLATVAASGPFSIFEGWWRHSTVVAGGGLCLQSASATLALKPHRVVGYDGGDSWWCKLEGETASVLNVMCESSVAAATVQLARELRMDSKGTIAILPVNCGAVCQVEGSSTSFLIPPGAMLLRETQGAPLTCRTEGGLSGESSYLLAIQIEPLTVEK
jgi:environmental stress-induced protein Ves